MRRIPSEKWILVTITVLMFQSWGAPAPGANVTVNVLDQVKVRSEQVTLGEIAEIEGEGGAVVEKLKAVVIGKSPLPGEVREFSASYIEAKLKQSDIDLSQLTLALPEKVKVVGEAYEVPPQKIEEMVKNFILQKGPWDPTEISLTVSPLKDINLTPGKITYEIIPPKKEDYRGTTNLLVLFMVNGKVEKKVWVNVQIEVSRDVVVSTHSLSRHSIITQDDLRLEKMNLADVPPDVVTDPLEIIGMRTKRVVDAHLPFCISFLEMPPVVKRGDLVTIVAETDAIKITTQGVVIENGGKGDMVRVVNTSSKRELFARVKDSKTVEVDF
jgi:flagella basal body P-ring formation protein FlgA